MVKFFLTEIFVGDAKAKIVSAQARGMKLERGAIDLTGARFELPNLTPADGNLVVTLKLRREA